MNRSFTKLLLVAGALPCFLAAQTTYNLKTAAGSFPDRNNRPASSIYLYSPEAVEADSAGNVYIADTGGHRIWKVDAGTGIATIISGTAANSGGGGDNGPADKATWALPSGIAIDSAGNIYVSDRDNHRVRKIDAGTKNITTFAGYGTGRYSGDGKKATDAGVNNPRGLAFDASGNLFIAAQGEHRIRKVDTNGIITTVAGVVGSGFDGDGGPAKFARLNAPEDVAFDASGNMYIADTNNHRVRMVDSRGVISTVVGTGTAGSAIDISGVGTGAQLIQPAGLAFSNGLLYISDRGNNRILQYNPDTKAIQIAIFARNASSGSTPAVFTSPTRIAVGSGGKIYVAEAGPTPTNVVRVWDPAANTTSVFAGAPHVVSDNTPSNGALFNTPFGVAVDSKNVIYFSDPPNNRVYKLQDGVVYVVAGTGVAASSSADANVGDGGPANNARLNAPRGVAVDAAGKLYIADSGTHRIRVVDLGGTISTIAGGKGSGFNSDNQPATSAQLNTPSGVSVDDSGNVYIADTNNHIIRKVATNGIITTVVGRQGVSGAGGDGGPASDATLNAPQGVLVDGPGTNLFIADTASCEVRQVVLTNGNIYNLAGEPGNCDRDGGPAAGSRLRIRQPIGLALEGTGNLLFSDQNNNRIRRVVLSTLQTTEIAGNGPNGPATPGTQTGTSGSASASCTTCYSTNFGGDGGSATASAALISAPAGLAFDSAGNLYVAEQGNGIIRQMTPNK